MDGVTPALNENGSLAVAGIPNRFVDVFALFPEKLNAFDASDAFELIPKENVELRLLLPNVVLLAGVGEENPNAGAGNGVAAGVAALKEKLGFASFCCVEKLKPPPPKAGDAVCAVVLMLLEFGLNVKDAVTSAVFGSL